MTGPGEGPRGAADEQERRLFIAVPVPDEVRDAIGAVVEAVRAGADPAGRDVRWVRLEGVHLTLRFLGPTPARRFAEVVDATDDAASRTPPFAVVIGGAGAFPSPNRPRALWLGVPEGGAALAAAAERVDEALAERGWPRSERPFRAHLTIARSDGIPSGPAAAARLVAAAAGLRAAFTATSIGVFESITGGGPARYVELHDAPLS